MISRLSILIPTYNKVCLGLVESLQAQSSLLYDFHFEIIVADDGSTDRSTVEANNAINNLPNCQYISRSNNTGRAAIRNFLAQKAKYEWLLYIDSNMKVISDNFIAKYHTCHEHDVIYGGYKVERNMPQLKGNLRYIFECASPQNENHELRLKNPYADFHTSNFIIKRNIMLAYPFDERFKKYGYEDVLFGKLLRENNIYIHHIDNVLGYDNFSSNHSFICKTEESLHTLYQFKDELQGYSKIIRYANHLERWHVSCLCKKLFPLLSLGIKARLTGNKPNIFLFNVYKLMYYISLS